MLKNLPCFLFFALLAGSSFSQPVASFNADLQSGCVPLSITFSNFSTGAATYSWDFGNGSGSTATNPSAVYNVPGTYTVTLIATSSTGLSDTLVRTAYIQVSALPVASFTQSVNSGCPYMTAISFTNTSTNSSSWLWDFGDGITSTEQHPVHIFPVSGTYNVKLIAYNNGGCNDMHISSAAITIHPQPDVQFSASQQLLCSPGQSVTFTPNTTTNTGYSWNFGNGNTSSAITPATIYNQPGIYGVQLIGTNSFGCKDTLSSPALVTVKNPVTPAMSISDSTGCAPFNTNFMTPASSGISSWIWDFGDGSTASFTSGTHTYSNPGTYTVTLTITTLDGCQYSSVNANAIEIPAPAIPMFTLSNNNGCAPLAVSFTNQSQNAVSYNWDFGTSNYSTQVNPTYTYGGQGNFTVTLHAFNSAGCESVYAMPNAVSTTRPYAAFTAANVAGCGPLTVSFGNQTTGATQYLWYFGDGTTSTQATPSHTYSLPGTYTVSLVATSAAGCRDSVAQAGVINVFNPAAGYVTPPVTASCVPYTVAFNDNSPGATGYLWDFGDGTTSTLPNPSHTYATPGDYTVSLIIYMAGGCNHYYPDYHSYHLEQMNAGYTLQVDCANGGVQFNDTTSGATTWFWDFGDGSTSSEQNPFHSYSDDIFSFSLTVGNTIGCTQSIFGLNQADMTVCSGGSSSPANGSGNSVVMNNINIEGCAAYQGVFINPYNSTSTLLWDFGDGGTSLQQDATHTYTQNGNYTVKLVIQETSGDIDTIIYPNALKIGYVSAGFSITNFPDCNNPQVTLQDQSQNAVSWLWQFGDGGFDTIQHPSHTYSNINAYTIHLTARDSMGCVSQTSASVFNNPFNTLWADKYKTCKNGTVNFTFTSSNFNTYLWNFGDGTTASVQNPSHTYLTGGNFQVSVTVTDNNGCPFTYNLPQPILIYEPIAEFSFAPTGSCSSNSVAFTNLSTGTGTPMMYFCNWSYGDGITQWAANPSHNYSSAGLYPVTLTVSAPVSGCNNSIVHMVSVGTPYVNFGFSQDKTCLPVTATFTDSSINAVSWLWEFGDGTTSTLQNPTHIYTTVPTNPVRLTITDNRGCQAFIVKPGIQLFNAGLSYSPLAGCAPFSVSFTDTTQTAASWAWNFGDGTTSTQQNPSHIYTAGGQYTAEVVITRADGCVDSLAITPIIVEQPIADFSSSSATSCAPAIIEFTNLSSNASSYFWHYGDSTQSNICNSSHVYNSPGYYDVTLIVFSPLGCADSVTMSNIVHIPGPVADFTSLVEAHCGYAEVNFQNTSSDYDFSQWNFGDGIVDSVSSPVHIYNNPGTYTVSLFVSDSAGCVSFASFPVQVNELTVPEAAFALSSSSGCSPFTVSVSNTSQNASVNSWNMGNGSVFVNNNPGFSFTYNSPGTYPVQLITESADGCTDTLNLSPIVVHSAPHVSISSSETTGCPGTTSLFTAVVSGADIASYNWSFSNGQTSTQQQPSVTFGPGVFNASLTVTDINGCSSSTTINAIVSIADSLPPALPEIKRVSVANDQSVTLEWFASVSGDVASYSVYRKNLSTGNFDFITTVNASQLSYIDNNLTTLINSYCYKIISSDTCGFSASLDSANAHCSVEITASRVSSQEVLVDWNFYAGTNVAGYEIYRSYNGSAFQLYTSVGSQENQWTDTTNYCNGVYRYKIRATGLHGQNIVSWSDTSAVLPGGIDFTQYQAEMKRSTVVNNQTVLTEWILPQELELVTTSVKLYRSTDKMSWTEVADIPLPYTSYVDEHADVHTQNYYYKIEPVNTCLLEVPVNISSSVLLQGERIDDFKTGFTWTEYEQWSQGVEEYHLQKKDPNGNWITIKVVPGNVTSTEIDE
ncbi:MAG: PKD domain-containing protein [Bacteroidota bacterium]